MFLIGLFQKISITIPQMAFRISKCKEGGGGLFELEFCRHWGILAIGIPKEWEGGGVQSWDSRHAGTDKCTSRVLLEKAFP